MTMFGGRASSGIPASRHRPRSVGRTGDLQAEILCWARDCFFRPPSFLLPSFLRPFLFVVSVSVSSLRCLRLIRERRRHEHATGNDIAPSTEHRARSRPRHPRRSRRARAGLWTLPVLWKTRAIPSASTDAVQKERFTTPWTPQTAPTGSTGNLVLALDHDITSRISKIRCDNHGRELTEQRRYAPTMSIPLRRNPCSRSPELCSPA